MHVTLAFLVSAVLCHQLNNRYENSPFGCGYAALKLRVKTR